MSGDLLDLYRLHRCPVLTVEAPPILAYEVWHKPHAKGTRRRKVATVGTHREAVALIQGDGCWYLIPVSDLAQVPGAGAEAEGLFE